MSTPPSPEIPPLPDTPSPRNTNSTDLSELIDQLRRLRMSEVPKSSKVVFAPSPACFDGNKKKYKSWKNSVKTYIVAYVEEFRIIKADAMADVKKATLRRCINYILAHMKSTDDEECSASI
jgi:hypothetical protein